MTTMMGKIPMSLGAIALGGVIGSSLMAGLAGSQSGKNNGLKLSEVSATTGITVAAAAVGATVLGMSKRGNDGALIGALLLGAASLVGFGGLAYGALNKTPPSDQMDAGVISGL
ncbi:MAG: hypothetical protein H7123_05555 [Thermoleophilia bacterium]|nr:hypothetical protein [Thermoleophilia bacterium]